MINNTREKLLSIFCDILQHTLLASEINHDHHLWDSLAHLNIILAIEEEFNIEIPTSDFGKLHNDYDTVLKYIEEKICKQI